MLTVARMRLRDDLPRVYYFPRQDGKWSASSARARVLPLKGRATHYSIKEGRGTRCGATSIRYDSMSVTKDGFEFYPTRWCDHRGVRAITHRSSLSKDGRDDLEQVAARVSK